MADTVKDGEISQQEQNLLNGEEEVDDTPTKRDPLTETQIRAYSIGHFMNDLCSSMWFIYLNYYLLYVVKLPPGIAAAALLSGQITDGLTTPIVGIASDKLSCPAGKRNCWYFMGSILVVPSFTGIFVTTPGFLTPGSNAENIWYCTLPAIFNVGWAAVQIAHMSIVNQLSYS